MTSRTLHKTVIFNYPFILQRYAVVLPAGIYRIDVKEERIDSLSFQTFIRSKITVYLPEILLKPGATGNFRCTPRDLLAAMQLDRNLRSAAKVKRLRKDRKIARDRFALERAENEGMLLSRRD